MMEGDKNKKERKVSDFEEMRERGRFNREIEGVVREIRGHKQKEQPDGDKGFQSWKLL